MGHEQDISFATVVGQSRPVGILQAAYAARRWPHCYVFAGPAGVGRSTVAHLWSRLILCACPVTTVQGWSEACGDCPSCRAIAAGTHPDLHLVYMELYQYTSEGRPSSSPVDLRIDVIRDFLIAKVAMRPILSGFRVFIIKQAERLNIQAQNALLKVLEEPPRHCCIILLCTRLDRLLPTVRSRSVVLRFCALDRALIEKRLAGAGVGAEAAQYLAALARGSLGTAKTLAQLEQAGAGLRESDRAIIEALVTGSLQACVGLVERALDLVDSVSRMWSEIEPEASAPEIRCRAHRLVMQMFVLIFQDVLGQHTGWPAALAGQARLGLIRRLSANMDVQTAIRAVERAYQACRAVESAANERLVWEWFLFGILREVKIHKFGGVATA